MDRFWNSPCGLSRPSSACQVKSSFSITLGVIHVDLVSKVSRAIMFSLINWPLAELSSKACITCSSIHDDNVMSSTAKWALCAIYINVSNAACVGCLSWILAAFTSNVNINVRIWNIEQFKWISRNDLQKFSNSLIIHQVYREHDGVWISGLNSMHFCGFIFMFSP